MQANIVVERLRFVPVEEQNVELVERKGLGHPDYIADAVAEASSVALSKYYLGKYGTILHHNLDKVLLVGGQSAPKFGGGEVLHPIYIIVAGRGTEVIINSNNSLEYVPMGTIVVEAVKDWIKKNFRFLDPERHVVVDYKIRTGSADLVQTYRLGLRSIPLSNDTSFGVSYAPLSTLERLVYSVERYLNSSAAKKELPEVGEDIKVMGLRVNNKIKLTVAAAMISSLIPDLSHYISVKEDVVNKVADLASKIAGGCDVEVYVNTADKPDRGVIYLSVTGTSAEHGDDGATGRGNRVNGLITPLRPMSLEATAGKNPVSHVGKLYNVLARYICDKVVNEVPKVKEVYMEILSQIGKPINEPLVAVVKLVVDENSNFQTVKSDVEELVKDELNNITKLTDLIIEGQVNIF
ncbi:MAG: methionine adenosyltransferase [Sulfolobales archaeon]|nr:methionine adenosyltransferase [Sulfolobales archaeon]MCX8185595.1 methionine adenosyltransferase [Sulfolobales archaeon]MDW7969538.1 methionine adenosyltransferase [Sulfolobales archaeon]